MIPLEFQEAQVLFLKLFSELIHLPPDLEAVDVLAQCTPQMPIGANDIWPLRDQFDENLGQVFSVWEVWG